MNMTLFNVLKAYQHNPWRCRPNPLVNSRIVLRQVGHQRIGVYTAKDYADILEFLVGRRMVENITGQSGEGRKAQDFVCGLPARIRRLEERAQGKAKEMPRVRFGCICIFLI
ncbi:hypothetical protein K1719_033737 [Acacia pycnantha]|nr:hypothetical protein K1719_033737 [Acacia pycnantha]